MFVVFYLCLQNPHSVGCRQSGEVERKQEEIVLAPAVRVKSIRIAVFSKSAF